MLEMNNLVKEIKSWVLNHSIMSDKPAELVSFTTNKDGSVSVWLIEPVTKSKSKLLFKLELKENGNLISVMMKDTSAKKFDIPQNVTEKRLKSSPENTYLLFGSDYDSAISFLVRVIISGVSDFKPSDRFGCCHRYAECSKEGKCIHPDQFYSLACWYRRNLEAGKIFY